jgi:hypothetical protein
MYAKEGSNRKSRVVNTIRSSTLGDPSSYTFPMQVQDPVVVMKAAKRSKRSMVESIALLDIRKSKR